jgi:hypothetical protein
MNHKTTKIFIGIWALSSIHSIVDNAHAEPVYIKDFSIFPVYPYNTSSCNPEGTFVGCGPTTCAMILAYYQHVQDMSLSAGLLKDPDNGSDEGLNTALALHSGCYMKTGIDGFGSVYDIEPGLENYAHDRGYVIDVMIHAATTCDPGSSDFQLYGPYGTSWLNDGTFWTYSSGKWGIDAEKFCNYVSEKLAAGIAIFLTIDTNLDGYGDHWVPLVGYDRTTLKYAYYNTDSITIQWADIYYCGARPRKDNSISYLRTITYSGPVQVKSYAFNENSQLTSDADLSAKIGMTRDDDEFYLEQELKDGLSYSGNSNDMRNGFNKNPENPPLTFRFEQNDPNPFSPVTTICYALPRPCEIRLVMYDILGKEISVLVHGRQPAGEYRITFNSNSEKSGIYFYKLITDTGVLIQKIALIK